MSDRTVRALLDVSPRIAAPPVWGPMTPARHAAIASRGIHLRVIVPGLGDVTRRARFFDDTPGRSFVTVYDVNEAGKYYVDPLTGRPAAFVVHGFFVVEGARLS